MLHISRTRIADGRPLRIHSQSWARGAKAGRYPARRRPASLRNCSSTAASTPIASSCCEQSIASWRGSKWALRVAAYLSCARYRADFRAVRGQLRALNCSYCSVSVRLAAPYDFRSITYLILRARKALSSPSCALAKVCPNADSAASRRSRARTCAKSMLPYFFNNP
jgi:hypothetical protein